TERPADGAAVDCPGALDRGVGGRADTVGRLERRRQGRVKRRPVRHEVREIVRVVVGRPRREQAAVYTDDRGRDGVAVVVPAVRDEDVDVDLPGGGEHTEQVADHAYSSHRSGRVARSTTLPSGS